MPDSHAQRGLPTEAAPYHGGDALAAALALGVTITDDLSTGINPWPYPFAAPPAESFACLPTRAETERLRAAAAAAYGVAEAGLVVPAPGTQALIQLLPRLRPPGRVLVVGPTYAEHAACWRGAGHHVHEVPDPDPSADVVVLCNPNNPDGRRIAPQVLADLGQILAARGGWLVVDEAFVDPTPELSLAPLLPLPGVIVLRSFGKFFGLAGVRLGFALAETPLAALLSAALGPWAVGGPTIAIGCQALGDREWIAATRARLGAAAAALDALLERHGLGLIGGTALFRLVRHARAHELFQALLRGGIFVRHFPERPDRLRFGLPGGADAQHRLDIVLKEALIDLS